VTINGVAIERYQIERWIDAPGNPIDVTEDEVVLFEAEVEMDARTGEYRLLHLRAELIPFD